MEMKQLILFVAVLLVAGCKHPTKWARWEVTFNCSGSGCEYDYIEGDIKQLPYGCIEYYHINDSWDIGYLFLRGITRHSYRAVK